MRCLNLRVAIQDGSGVDDSLDNFVHLQECHCKFRHIQMCGYWQLRSLERYFYKLIGGIRPHIRVLESIRVSSYCRAASNITMSPLNMISESITRVVRVCSGFKRQHGWRCLMLIVSKQSREVNFYIISIDIRLIYKLLSGLNYLNILYIFLLPVG